ncbi:MAG TPA: LLM class flavin-dependent oxidoreductase [Candidatus Binataceae bacterium]|nr:LLM class flavin-dependent oxidoreductase [Candidatus Binataceae bacterium]
MARPFGIAIPQVFLNSPIDLELLRKFIPRAEALGYDSLWVQEQIIGTPSILEPVTLLTYAAALTSKMRLGSSVLLTVVRNPVQLAKALATLDQLSHGRLTVGVGVGGKHVPEAVFRVSSEKRGRQFVEGIKVMKALWTQPKASMSGEFWNFENVSMEPKPAQKPHPPVWFGAKDELAFKRAVRHGDGWMGAGSSSSSDFVEHFALLRKALDDAKRDPATFTTSKRVYLAVDDNRERAERRLREWFGERYKNADMGSRVSIWGGRAECIDKVGALLRAGAQHLLLNPVFDEIEHAELLAQDIIPRL